MLELVTPDDPRLAWYRGVSDPRLLRDGQRFIVEGRRIVARLLESERWEVESLLVSPPVADVLEPLMARHPELPAFVLPAKAFEQITGFGIHRGCLAVGKRPPRVPLEALVPPSPEPCWLLGLEALGDADNVGACFRNAAAFGVDLVALDGQCCDPLYRKAIRTSMGAALRVRFAQTEMWSNGIAWLRDQHVVTVALTPRVDAEIVSDLPQTVLSSPRIALFIGNEGSGLEEHTLDACDRRVRIAMSPGEDSLNAATAAAVALHVFAQARHRARLLEGRRG